jgi:hypothetical protein
MHRLAVGLCSRRFRPIGSPAEGLIDFVEQPLLPLQQAQLPLPLFFGAANVGGVAVGFALAQAGKLFGDPRLQRIALTEQHCAKKALLRGIHIVIRRLGEQLGGGKRACVHHRDSLDL